jgi:hypothetical protein
MFVPRRFSNLMIGLLVMLAFPAQAPAARPVHAAAPAGQGRELAAPARPVSQPEPPAPDQPVHPGWEPAILTLDAPLPEPETPPPPLGQVVNEWTTILDEDFSGAFPPAGWSMVDGNGPTGGDVRWDRESYLAHSASYSAWAAGGGANGRDPALSGYPNQVLSYLIYGPFSMAGASSATLSFSYWNQTETGDILYAQVSTDGKSWSGWANTTANTNGWRDVSFDLSAQSGLNIANQPAVRIAFIFYSDNQNVTPAIAEKGPFIDDVLLEKNFGPDLTFITPNDPATPWDGPIIASNDQNNHRTTAILATDKPTYVDWAAVNRGASTSKNFTSCLYLETHPDPSIDVYKLVHCQEKIGLDGGAIWAMQDHQLSVTPGHGFYKLKVVFDVNNDVAETDETNNVVERQFRWARPAAPDLLPHAPEGWSYPIVPASIMGTTTFFTVRSGTNTFIDWAVINLSEASVSTNFTTCLYLDGNEVECWIVSQDLGAGVYYFRDDESMTPPAAGQHQLALVVDVENAVEEANEYNNTWQRWFTWYPRNTCGPILYQPPEGDIPAAGDWVSWELSAPPAPEGALLGDVSLKFAIDHPAPREVDVYLMHQGSPVPVRVETAGLDLAGGREATVVVAGFIGRPAAGSWTVWLRDPQPGRVGRLLGASLTTLPALPGQSGQDQGAPAAFTLPQGAQVVQLTPAETGLPTAPPGPPILADGWAPVLYENFEGSFPSTSVWALDDQVIADNCQYLWDEDDREHAPGGGAFAAWPANGGQHGLDPAASLYPPNMDSWLIFGPLDLSKAGNYRLSFDLKREIEPVHDYLFVGASGDANNFTGLAYSGGEPDEGWSRINLRLAGYSGDSSVWIAFRFVSDPSNQKPGAWIDNILVAKLGETNSIFAPFIRR